MGSVVFGVGIGCSRRPPPSGTRTVPRADEPIQFGLRSHEGHAADMGFRLVHRRAPRNEIRLEVPFDFLRAEPRPLHEHQVGTERFGGIARRIAEDFDRVRESVAALKGRGTCVYGGVPGNRGCIALGRVWWEVLPVCHARATG